MLHAQNTPAAVAAAAVAAGHQLLASTAAGFDSHDDVAGNASPSKTLMKPPLNLGLNPHHPAVTARASSASTTSATSATTPTSPRPSATDLGPIL